MQRSVPAHHALSKSHRSPPQEDRPTGFGPNPIFERRSDVSAFLQDQLRLRGSQEVAAVEAAKWLDQAGLLPDSDSDRGYDSGSTPPCRINRGSGTTPQAIERALVYHAAARSGRRRGIVGAALGMGSIGSAGRLVSSRFASEEEAALAMANISKPNSAKAMRPFEFCVLVCPS